MQCVVLYHKNRFLFFATINSASHVERSAEPTANCDKQADRKRQTIFVGYGKNPVYVRTRIFSVPFIDYCNLCHMSVEAEELMAAN